MAEVFRVPEIGGAFNRGVTGRTIIAVDRRAKRILVHLDADCVMVVHQKISGRLLVGSWERVEAVGASGGRHRIWRPIPPSRGRYVHLLFELDDGRQLALSDLRKFATVMVGRTGDILNRTDLRTLGPEPLDPRFSLDAFKQRCAHRRGRIKTLLMTPTFVAGIGNIYSDEILYSARLHPLSRIERMQPRHLRALYRSLRLVLRRAVRLRGTGVDAPPLPLAGAKGYDRVRLVYHRSVCPRGHPLTRVKIGGRSAHFCPTEQELV